MMIETKECIVHNRKYLSKFHGNINQLRRTNEFDASILQKLPKRCCSCYEQNGEKIFDLNHLRQLCQEIQPLETPLPIKDKPVKPIHYVILDFPTDLTSIQRITKAGRFVGRRGQHLKLIEQKFQIILHIVNKKSKEYFRQIVDQLKQENKENSSDALWILIYMKTDQDNIQKIKQSLINEWNKTDVTRKNIQMGKSSQSRNIIPPSTDLEGDTRWKPKKQSLKYQQKRKEKQSNQQEDVQPQPFIRPISMATQILKSEKSKRK